MDYQEHMKRLWATQIAQQHQEMEKIQQILNAPADEEELRSAAPPTPEK